MDACTFAYLQQIYAERDPYFEEFRLSGNTIIFDEVFIRLCEEAFDTGCLKKMSGDELALFKEFIKYQDGDLASVPTDVVALDTWFTNMINGVDNPQLSTCVGTIT